MSRVAIVTDSTASIPDNLITDLVGGIRVTVLEEEVLARVVPADGAGPTTTSVTPSRADRRRQTRQARRSRS